MRHKTISLPKNDACRSLPPCFAPDARILILGSMPGAESLRRGEYYAFRHNVFWRIAGELFGFDPALSYGERLAALQRARVALWDVLGACSRRGSLDSEIREGSPNDIASLLAAAPEIGSIFCNGSAAHLYFRRFFPEFATRAVLLPSTSPAAARLDYVRKLAAWRAAIFPDRLPLPPPGKL